MTDFNKAFAKARKEKGAKGTFEYKGKKYNTARKDDPGQKKQERKQDVSSKNYNIQDVSKIQENKKGKFVTGVPDQGSVKDTTYLPKGMKHYSGKQYKKGDWLDETDFEEKVGKSSPGKYSPFKMKAAAYGNSPMKKNFGVGEKESPKEIDNPNK